MNDILSLRHAVWHCKYHIVWIPKCRRKVLYGERKRRRGWSSSVSFKKKLATFRWFMVFNPLSAVHNFKPPALREVVTYFSNEGGIQ
jgi:hypothetical protein